MKEKDTLKLTPMLQQYMSIKNDYKDAILLFRMGDFYEMFFEDAVEASTILNVVLTSRDQDIPMCGVPYHSVENYIAKLLSAGKKVAICEQVEDPKLAKGIVKREVVRILSPGIQPLETETSSYQNNYLLAIYQDSNKYAISYADILTGEFKGSEFSDFSEFLSEVTRIQPAEIILPENIVSLKDILKTHLTNTYFTVKPLEAFTPLNDHTNYSILIQQASSAIIRYIKETQRSENLHLSNLVVYEVHDYLVIDEITQRNLELVQNNFDKTRRFTLLSTLDYTVTPMGARALKQWILYPLKKPTDINDRLDAVEYLIENQHLRGKLRDILKGVTDLEKHVSRVSLSVSSPKDILKLRQSLEKIPELIATLKDVNTNLLASIRDGLRPLPELCCYLRDAIVDNPPTVIKDGKFIKEGFNKELDELIKIQRDAKEIILEMEKKERERTQIPNLKIGYNRVFGYYFEISKGNLQKVPDYFIRKQTLVNAERFITPELKELEEKILHAEEKRIELELSLFREINEKIKGYLSQIQENARHISILDVLTSLAEASHVNGYKRPIFTQGERIIIKDGRHPVLEKILPVGEMIPNDVELDGERTRFILITGPNMGGKSTVLRMTGLLAIMAHIGSFVPAEYMELGIIDRIFTRVGATDYITKGQSTFMVEMTETANILKYATSKSLVLLDEVGRGTSTFDGMALAWAISEELLQREKKGVLTLFATHYHELTSLQKRFKKLRNMHVGVKEWEDKIIFLYKLQDGAIDQSYGIHVAKLAGIPQHVIKRAEEILREIERKEQKRGTVTDTITRLYNAQKSLPLEVNNSSDNQNKLNHLINKLLSIDLNQITPLDAMLQLKELQDICKKT